MDRSRLTLSSLDELKQIRADICICPSLDLVRRSFERVQEIRRQHLDDFDLQMIIADAQQEIIERARVLRKNAEHPASAQSDVQSQKPATKSEYAQSTQDRDSWAVEIPPEVPKLDRKSWQLAVTLAVIFTAGIFASFFYLIQTARRLNFADEGTQPSPNTRLQSPVTAAPAQIKMTPVAANPTVSPTLRLYTDLTGGTATIDDQPARDLVDGELDLDSLKPGQHNVLVESRAGSAAFSFAIDGDTDVPHVTQISKSYNSMVVLVSVKDGTGRLNADAGAARVLLDSKPAGTVGSDGLLLPDLGTQDHDLDIVRAGDHQKFVLTYTPAPTLTVFVKSDPSTGVLTVSAGQDGASVFVNDVPYKRVTEHGQVRIPLKVGAYHIRVHKAGFHDPAEALVEVKKNAEASVQFRFQTDSGILQIKGAQPGTTVYIDRQIAATVGVDSTAKVTNVKPGDHVIELRHDQTVPRQLTRTFTAGQTVTLLGADTALDHYAADNKTIIPAMPGPAVVAPPEVPQLQPAVIPVAIGEQVHKGGGFIPYHTPKSPGNYYFQAHTKLGGIFKRGRLQWYAGYKDSSNYLLFSLDGKHAEVTEVRDGRQLDLGKIPFNLGSDQWVQIEMSIKPDAVLARAKAGLEGWIDLTPVNKSGRDFTKQSVGLLVPTNEEVAIANFRFSGK